MLDMTLLRLFRTQIISWKIICKEEVPISGGINLCSLIAVFYSFLSNLNSILFISYLNEWQYIEISLNTFSRFRQYERMFLMFWCCFVFIFGDRMLVMAIVCLDKNYCYFFPFQNVIQRRQNGDINFYRNWKDYKNGFGHADDEYRLGRTQLTFLYT